MAACNISGWNVPAIHGVSLLPSGVPRSSAATMPVWARLLGGGFGEASTTAAARLVGLASA